MLKALGHPERLRLLEALTQGEVCVCHLATLLGRSQPYTSKQLAALRESDLVLDRRDGQRIYYRLASDRVAGLLEAVRRLPGSNPFHDPPVLDGCPCPRCAAARRVAATPEGVHAPDRK